MERVILLGTDQLPVSIYNDYSCCQSSLPHCFHLPADKCLYKNVAAVKGIFDSTYVSWNEFCRQSGLCPEVSERIILQNDKVRDHKNSNHSLDITRILVDFSCYNRKNQLLYTNASLTKIKNCFSPSDLFIPLLFKGKHVQRLLNRHTGLEFSASQALQYKQRTSLALPPLDRCTAMEPRAPVKELQSNWHRR